MKRIHDFYGLAMKSVKSILFITFIVQAIFARAQTGVEVPKLQPKQDTTFKLIEDDPVLMMIDSLMAQDYFNSLGFDADYTPFVKDSIPEFDTETYQTRLYKLNATTPFSLIYNDHVAAFIRLYADRRRSLTAKELGLSKIYFPIFEEMLDKYDMPLELKYLAIVESALNPRARSHAGAVGLWQFMYRTGRMFGLEVNSYYDERMSIHKSTDAACRYLKKLYMLYEDWDLALAAYNCGPGNVNRAIRRAGGGKKTYWEIFDYLPRETRGYVPAFIAVNYVMHYHKEHNIRPRTAKVPHIVVDTVYVNDYLSFDQLSECMNIPLTVLEYYNPEYKLNVIPYGGEAKMLTLPANKIGEFLLNENTIYAHKTEEQRKDSIAASTQIRTIAKGDYVTHKVKSGEVLGVIAEKYKVRVTQIREWNNLRGSRIYVGQSLKIYTSRKYPSTTPAHTSKPAPAQKLVTNGKYQYYTVRSGDNLWTIARKYPGVSLEDIQKLNPELQPKGLKPGMKIRIKKIG